MTITNSRSERLRGKVALVTGAARGIGRAAAVQLASEGAHIIALDACSDRAHVPYPLASRDDLAETAQMVRDQGTEAVTCQVDVCQTAELARALEASFTEFGRLDIVCANAGIVAGSGSTWELTEEQWTATHAVNVTGVWNTVRAALPHLRNSGGGSVVITASTASFHADIGLAHYTSAAHCLDGLRKALAIELAPFNIRVNSVNPCQVATTMFKSTAVISALLGKQAEHTIENASRAATLAHLLPVPWVEPTDVSAGIAYLVSPEARYVTGSAMVIDAGATQSFKDG